MQIVQKAHKSENKNQIMKICYGIRPAATFSMPPVYFKSVLFIALLLKIVLK